MSQNYNTSETYAIFICTGIIWQTEGLNNCIFDKTSTIMKAKRFLLLFLNFSFILPLSLYSQSTFCLSKDTTGVRFGILNMNNSQFTTVSSIICQDVNASTFDASKSQFLIAGNEIGKNNQNKLYVVNSKYGSIISSAILDENIRILSLHYNSKDSATYAIYKERGNVCLGKINPNSAEIISIFKIQCADVFSSVINPAKNNLLLLTQEFSGLNLCKIIKIDLYSGNVLNTISKIDNNVLKNLQYNLCDSLIYGLLKDDQGVRFGRLNTQNGLFDTLSSVLCYDSEWSFIDPSRGVFVFKGQISKDSDASKIFTLRIKNSVLISSIATSKFNSGATYAEADIKYCAPKTAVVQTVFNPGKDGAKPLYLPEEFAEMQIIEFKIYNRWGNIVYDWKNNPKGWDGKSEGKNCSDGTYFWSAKLIDGTKNNVSKTGNITLLW